MNYITSKLTFLLYEYYYNKENSFLEKDLCDIIHKFEKRDWIDLNFDKCINILQGINPKYSEKPYSWVKSEEEFIKYLEYLPVDIAENQAEREIARSEAIGDYIYENGYDSFMMGGF